MLSRPEKNVGLPFSDFEPLPLYNHVHVPGQKGMNFVNNKQNFIIKEAHKVLTAGFYRSTQVDRGMDLCQPGYSAEQQPGVLSFSINVTKTAFL